MGHSTLNRRLHEFRCIGKYCDVSILVQDTTFHCHSLVLASMSPYFDTVFQEKNTSECQSKDVVMNMIDAVTFKQVLEYVYTERLPDIDSSNIEIFLKVGKFLEMDVFISRCHGFIYSNTSCLPYNQLFRLLGLTHALNISELKDHLSQYITQNLMRLIGHHAFSEVPYEIVKIVMERYRSSASYSQENFLLGGLIRWIFHSYEDRRKYYEELEEMVDFEKISSEYVESLSKVVDKVDVNDKASSRIRMKNLVQKCGYAKDQLLAAYKDPQISGNPTIHVYCESRDEMETDYQIFSLDERKLEPEWICSRRFSRSHRYCESPVVDFITCNDHVYCFEIVPKNEGSLREKPIFGTYTSLDFASESLQILSPFPLMKESLLSTSNTRMTGFGSDRIYLYSSNIYDFSRVKNTPYVKNFNKEEYKRHFYEYNLTQDEWLPVNPMKRPVKNACLIADDELVYLIGGKDESYYGGNESVERYAQAYNPRLKTWLKLPRTNFSHKNASGCNLNGRIYIWNGEHIEVYDPQASKWQATKCNFTTKVKKFRKLLLPFKNQLYLFDFYCTQFCTYNPLSQEWSSLFEFDTIFGDEMFSSDVKNIVVFKSL